MNTKLARAIMAAETAKAQGTLDFKTATWLVAAWVAFAAESVVQLANPNEYVDKAALTDMLETSWKQLSAVIDDIPMSLFTNFIWVSARSRVLSVIPSAVDYLATELDKGENHS
jgi:hypothetical protein